MFWFWFSNMDVGDWRSSRLVFLGRGGCGRGIRGECSGFGRAVRWASRPWSFLVGWVSRLWLRLVSWTCRLWSWLCRLWYSGGRFRSRGVSLADGGGSMGDGRCRCRGLCGLWDRGSSWSSVVCWCRWECCWPLNLYWCWL